MAEKKRTSKRPAPAGQTPKSTSRPVRKTAASAPASKAPAAPVAKAPVARATPASAPKAPVRPAPAARGAKSAPASPPKSPAPAAAAPTAGRSKPPTTTPAPAAKPKAPPAAPAPSTSPVAGASSSTAGRKTADAVRPSAGSPPSVPPGSGRSRVVAPGMIPPILFEGDDAGSAPVSGPGQRYALTAVPLVEAAAEGGELPEAYGTRKLWVAARDPHWLYAHWDFSRDQLRAANALARDGHLFLRVHAADGRRESEVSVHPESRHWFLHVGHAGAVYTVELGYTDHAGNWQRLDTAAAVITPPDTLAPVVEAEFESIPVDVPFVDLIAAVRAVVDEHTPLIELLPLLRAQRWPGLPAAAESPSPVEWTPAREEALARVVNVDAVRRVWIGSLEITELVRRKLERDWSSQAAAGALPAGLPGGAGGPGTVAGGLGSPSSPFGGEAAPHQDFWFNVNAELVIYGATEPGASVTLAGRAVALRPDGSFSFRFALPDGQFDLPAVATSADGTDRRSAALRFGRSTTYRGDVGRHPQNPALRSPRAEHLREAQDR